MIPDLTILSAGRAEILVAFLRAFLRSPSSGKFRLCIGNDGSFPPLFLRRLAEIPNISVFDYAPIFAAARAQFHRDEHHAGWATKPAVIARCPTRWCLWLDHDCEVLGDLSPIAEYAIASGKWFAAPFYASLPTLRYAWTRLAQNGLCVVDTHSPRLAEWLEATARRKNANDEESFVAMYGSAAAAATDCCDLARANWYASPDCFADRIRGWHAASEAMARRSPPPIVRHWTAGQGKIRFRALYPGHRFRLPHPARPPRPNFAKPW